MKKLLSMVLCLCMVLSLLSVSVAAAGFSDVKAGAYYEKSVSWAVEQGITAGKKDGTFAPNETCSRAHILTFLWRAAGAPKSSLPENYYEDVKPSDYYFEAARWASERGLVDIEGIYFNPGTPCTRADAVQYIWRYAGWPKADEVSFKDVSGNSNTAKAIYWAVRYGVTNGKNATTFDQKSTTTRAQIVTFLYRYFVEPLQFVESATPAPTPKPETTMKLDPLPPLDYTKQPDWYGSLTPAHTMSNTRLIAELEQIDRVIDERRAQDIYMSDGPYSRQLDLWSEASQRYDAVKSYDRYVRYGDPVPERTQREYDELVATYGDPQPLRDYFD